MVLQTHHYGVEGVMVAHIFPLKLGSDRGQEEQDGSNMKGSVRSEGKSMIY